MSLKSGQMLSHYRLVSLLGEGGMGVVWKATDTTLGRDVAVKVLPDLFSRDAERLTRFEREARLLASLNHPNIAGIFGLHESDGSRFLAMELIPGEDLAKRLQQGPLPVEEALQIARQVAEALEAAHEHGVVHRDLKPANIQLSADGAVKVVDFGLAKALVGDASSGSTDLSLSPTMTAGATLAGVILGTAAYMSPEQAKGKPVDRRADIWGFGAVLFEMLAGRRLFVGETISEILASVIKSDPEWDLLPSGLRPELVDLLHRCLEKDPRRRLRDIGDARIALEEMIAGRGRQPAAAVSVVSAAPVSRGRHAALLAGVALGAAALTALAAWSMRPAPPVRPPLHLEVVVSGDLPLFQSQGSGVVISPDGRMIAYATGTPTNSSAGRINIRPLDRLESIQVIDSDNGYNPFYSPDGKWIGFATPTSLKKVSVAGGTPLTLCPVALSRGAAWGEKGAIVLTPNPNAGLSTVPSAGGALTELTQLGEGEVSHRWPQFLPGGKRVLFTSYTSAERNSGRIEVVDLDTKVRTLVHQGGTYGRYIESGHVIFVNSGTLFAAPFDLAALKTTASPSPVLQGISFSSEGGSQVDVSRDGTIIYLTGQASDAKSSMIKSDRQGRTSQASETKREYAYMRRSPDGKRLALVAMSDGNMDIWVHDLQRDTQTRMTFDPARDLFPVWSPDGGTLYFTSNRGGKWGIFRKPADGSGQEERILETINEPDVYSISPDGRLLAYHDTSATNEIWILPLEPGGKPAKLFESPASDGDPVFSPDGRWISYDSDESGRWEVYVRPAAGSGGKWQVSTQGGEFARWSGDGAWLYYKDRSGSAWAVPVTSAGGQFHAGKPEKLFTLPGMKDTDWDVTADGKEFYFVQQDTVGTGGLTHVKLTFGWFEELKGLLAGAR